MNDSCFFDVLKEYEFEIDEGVVRQKHIETLNHSIRCFEMAEKFGLYLGYKGEDIKILSHCSLLHDLGKFYLNEKILYKVERLTDDEFGHLKTHVNHMDLYDKAKFHELILETIKYHHDNFMETGYNKINIGLKHEFVRIVAIVDCFDAMVSKRCYSSHVLTVDEALHEIFINLGKQFDLHYGMEFIKFIKGENYMDIVV